MDGEAVRRGNGAWEIVLAARPDHCVVRPLREAFPAVVGGHRGVRGALRLRGLRLGLRRHGRVPGGRVLAHVLLPQSRAAAPGGCRRRGSAAGGRAGGGGAGQRRRRSQPGGHRRHPGVRVPPEGGCGAGAGGAVRGVHQRRARRGGSEAAAVVRAHVPRAVHRRVAARARHLPDVPCRRQGCCCGPAGRVVGSVVAVQYLGYSACVT